MIGFLMFLERIIQYSYKKVLPSVVEGVFGNTGKGNSAYHYYSSILPLSAVVYCFISDYVDSGKLIIVIFCKYLIGFTISCLALHFEKEPLYNFGCLLCAVGSGGLVMCIPGFGRKYSGDADFFLDLSFFTNFGCFFGLTGVSYAVGVVSILKIHLIMFVMCALLFVGFLGVFYLVRKNISQKVPEIVIDSSTDFEHTEGLVQKEEKDEKAKGMSSLTQLVPIVLVFFPLIPYFAMKDQYNSTWLDLSKTMKAFGKFDPKYAPSLNPLFLCILVPIVKFIRLSDPKKIVLGYFLAVLAFSLCLSFTFLNLKNQSVLIMFPLYAILSMGEILCYITNHEYAYSIAPANRKFFVLSFIRMMEFFANFTTGKILDRQIDSTHREKFTFWTAFGAVGLIIYAVGLFVFEKKRRAKKIIS